MTQGTVSAGITRLIGNTPLLRVRMFERDFPAVEVYAKAEWFNPGGSVKDRAALSMIEDGERRGVLRHEKTIIDSTSGNTGIAYAMVGAAWALTFTFALVAFAWRQPRFDPEAPGHPLPAWVTTLVDARATRWTRMTSCSRR